MRLFSEFLGEDAGDKFRAMSDSQFDGWKKANPGAAEKADKLRSGNKEPGSAARAAGGAITKGVDLVKAKADQRQRQAKEKSALVKQQAQDKRAEQKKDQEEKKALKKDQEQRKQDLNKQASQQKKQERKEKSASLGKKEPGGALVRNMKSKVKKPKKKIGGPNRLAQAGDLAKRGLGKALNLGKGLAKGAWNAAKSTDTTSAVGIGDAPGDQRGLAQRTSNL